jgi:pimeloyl-ACP methyl ester carboxylesterase
MTGGDEEGIWTAESLPITFAQVRAARLAGLKPIPLVVLAAGNLEGDLGPDSPFPPASNAIWPTEYLLLQTTLATLTPDAKLIVVAESGHMIHEEQPQAVIAAVMDVVDAVRDPASWQDAVATPTS